MQTVMVVPGESERFWNQTPFRSYLFNAFSLLLPSGEQFVIRAMEDAATHLPEGAPLQDEVAQFVREERAHQRAHRLYNAQLAAQGYNAIALEARIERAVQGLEHALSWRERLALAAALEYLTALVSRHALRGEGWLVHNASRQSSLWRWHCEEEVAHHGVALRMLCEVGRVGYGRRMALYVLASLILLGDVARHTWDFFQTDRAQGRLGWLGGARSVAGFVLRQAVGLARMAVGWLGYGLPMHRLAPASQVGRNAEKARIEVRPLQACDIPRLLVLEHKKWSDGQAADADAMAQRIAAHPQLCMGAFCPRTGEALASLFLKPISAVQLQSARTWADCAKICSHDGGQTSRDLFGISLSSISPQGVEAIFAFFWPRALKAGWRQIYLGSPVPGLARWRRGEPDAPVESYVYAMRRGGPQDPQLRYYWQKGFKTIVACKAGYFPHAASLDYGVVVRGRIPLSFLAPLWRHVPLSWLRGMERCLARGL
ncbi:metal-dependent hydrolase [Acidovorax sp. Root267]|uniref:metal-dependent hydrolase n=1 Tax=Acidovorax sp. Root267 TaxID=1736505 RepID=UPI000A615718|nr:metal-dependent hydrolase [Acidovorax sp. Root267]